jgi:hypothetical protein
MQIQQFVQTLFTRKQVAVKASRIVRAILEAQSARLTEIARVMPGSLAARYKELQRFVVQNDVKAGLLRLLQPDATFVIGDVTEIPRRQARRTEYVGKLSDGKTRGFWLLMLATPFQGRAIPFHFITYSSKTIRQEATSRNMEHCRALAGIKAVLGNRPLILDREFSYLELLLNLAAEEVHFVIRLNLGSHPPLMLSKTGQRIDLVVSPEQTVVYRDLLYKEQVRVHVIGHWQRGFGQPLWLITDLQPEQALSLYQQRMKIEESFRDLKNLLGVDRIMNQRRDYLEQILALVMIAYAIGLLLGESLRDKLFDTSHSKRRLYSGLFLLLEHRPRVPHAMAQQIASAALLAFTCLVSAPVRTHV